MEVRECPVPALGHGLPFGRLRQDDAHRGGQLECMGEEIAVNKGHVASPGAGILHARYQMYESLSRQGFYILRGNGVYNEVALSIASGGVRHD